MTVIIYVMTKTICIPEVQKKIRPSLQTLLLLMKHSLQLQIKELINLRFLLLMYKTMYKTVQNFLHTVHK